MYKCVSIHVDCGMSLKMMLVSLVMMKVTTMMEILMGLVFKIVNLMVMVMIRETKRCHWTKRLE